MPHLGQQAQYTIKIDGCVDATLIDWFGPIDLATVKEDSGRTVTTLSGLVTDQSGMVGLLRRLHGLRNVSGTRVVASASGILTGLAGMEHGFFEMLQGSVAPSGVMIEAIGPAQRFWELGTEAALTVVPNFFVTGILAMMVGLAVII